MRLIDPNSVIFLAGESRNQPMHVAGLQLFEPAPDAGPDTVRRLFESAIATEEIAPLFLRHPQRAAGVGPWTWVEDPHFDIEHHVRHSALPRPGRIRELLELVSRLHGTAMTRQRPMWEAHLIEGLADGRFALYTKLHHSLVDGISGMRLMQSAMTGDPGARDMPLPFDARVTAAARRPRQTEDGGAESTVTPAALRSAYGMLADAAGLPGALVKTLNKGVRNETSAISLHAPRSAFNVPISGARRFAADSWSLARLRAVATASGTSLNDVVLAMCGGALRAYLLDLNRLPDTSLVAMVPVALSSRSEDSTSGRGGNAVGAVMSKLATDTPDPAVRLAEINASMRAGKEALASMSPSQILAMSAIGMAPAIALPMLRLDRVVRPPFNLIISNVPGPREPQYLNGARMTDIYPVSIPINGIALNITCNSYADDMGFGLTGCRRAVPSLQRLLGHLDDELVALERAVGAS